MSAEQPTPARDDAAAFRAKFRASKNIIVIAGAGLSAASGIPTFRDGGGMWRSLNAQELATSVAFEANPALVWQFYHYRRTTALSAKPNPAHKILAKMSIPTELKKVAPQAKSFHLITQNVDRLSVQALEELTNGSLEELTNGSDARAARAEPVPKVPASESTSDKSDAADATAPTAESSTSTSDAQISTSPTPAPSFKSAASSSKSTASGPLKPRRTSPTIFPRSILEMHGRLFDVRCTDSSCGHVEEDRSSPLCPALGEAEAGFACLTDIGRQTTDPGRQTTDAGRQITEIPPASLPRCRRCGALARPGVVWFGEMPYFLDEINSLVFKADMCLVVGTSATVRPASTYAYRVHRHGGTVAIFNREPSEADERADFIFRGGCEEVLPELFAEFADGKVVE